MKRIRISGLVRVAKHVRQELSQPVSAGRLAQLQEDVSDAVGVVEKTLRDEGVRLRDLPSPSQRAYQFLKGVDFSTVTVRDPALPDTFPPESVSFPGLPSYFNGLLNQLARCDVRSHAERIYTSIQSAGENIERQIHAENIQPEQIKRQSRAIRAWLAYFSRRKDFDCYLAAVQKAMPIFQKASGRVAGQSPAVLLHLRPMQGVYRVRRYRDAVLVQLPTPMMCFDDAVLGSLAALVFRRSRDKRPVLDAMVAEPYRMIVSELELLGGIVAQTNGLCHDLAASFDRVNARYFNAHLTRPHLVWSRTFTVRKYGHYDQTKDTVMVSMSLDKKAVPEHTVDFIVYHELLHKVLGVTWKNGRMAVHTQQFTERERAFVQYREAKAVLSKLAREQ